MASPRSAELTPEEGTRRSEELTSGARGVQPGLVGLINAGLEQIVRRGAETDATVRVVVAASLGGAGARHG